MGKIWENLNKPLSVVLITLSLTMGLYLWFVDKEEIECELTIFINEDILREKYNHTESMIELYRETYSKEKYYFYPSFEDYQEALAYSQILENYKSLDWYEYNFICDIDKTIIPSTLSDFFKKSIGVV